MSNKHSNIPVIMRDLDSIIGRWASGKATQVQLAREYHVSVHSLTAAIKSRMPDDVFLSISADHRRTSKPVALLSVRVWYRRSKHGSGRRPKQPKRRFIKVGNDPDAGVMNWMPLSRWLWEKEHGPVPEGYFVGYIDGNRMNDSLENLHLVSYAESAREAVSKCDGAKRGARISKTKKAQAAIQKRIAGAHQMKRNEATGARFEEMEDWEEDWFDEEAA